MNEEVQLDAAQHAAVKLIGSEGGSVGIGKNTENILDICYELKKRKLLCEFNIVRYNPYSPIQGEESDEEVIHDNMVLLKDTLQGKVQVIPRVGFDVKASCGMFVDKGI